MDDDDDDDDDDDAPSSATQMRKVRRTQERALGHRYKSGDSLLSRPQSQGAFHLRSFQWLSPDKSIKRLLSLLLKRLAGLLSGLVIDLIVLLP